MDMKRFANFLLGAFAAMLAFASPTVLAEGKPKEIRIAVPDLSIGGRNSGTGIVDVQRELRVLEKAFAGDGIAVQWRFFKGAGPVINEAIANGQVDLAYLADLAAIIGKASGLDTRLLSATGRNIRMYLAVTPGLQVKRLEDLKGKRIGIFRGTANQLSFAAALKSAGLTEKDFQVINLDASAAASALAAKRIDATWGTSALWSLKFQGLADIPLSSGDFGGTGSIQTVLVGAGPFVDAYPQVIERLLAAQQQGFEWLAKPENKRAYVELLARNSGYPKEIPEADLGDVPLDRIFGSRLDAAFLGRLQQQVDLAAELKLIRGAFDVGAWVHRHPAGK